MGCAVMATLGTRVLERLGRTVKSGGICVIYHTEYLATCAYVGLNIGLWILVTASTLQIVAIGLNPDTSENTDLNSLRETTTIINKAI